MSELDLLRRKLAREIAARKAAEMLLEKKSLELFDVNEKLQAFVDHTRAILETAAEGIITYEESGTIRTFNRSARTLFGIDDAIGSDIRHLFRLNEEQVATLFGQSNDGGVIDQTSEIIYQLAPLQVQGIRHNDTFLCELSLSRAMIASAPTFIAVARDLTKRKQLETRLSQVRNMESIGQLAAGVAHEINTPVQFIGNNINFLEGAFEDIESLLELYEQLRQRVQTDHPCDTIVEQINEQIKVADLSFLRSEFPLAISQSLEGIDRVTRIVLALKEFSSPSTTAKASIDINDSIKTALAITANRFRDVAKVQTNFDMTLPNIIGIGGQFNQSILNILTNAADAVEIHRQSQAGLVVVETRQTESDIEIRFHDNGCGVPPHLRDRIFDPFFTTKDVGQGAGQGLAFVYDVIVNKHCGTVSAHSRREGGTTVLLTLPTRICEYQLRREHENTVS